MTHTPHIQRLGLKNLGWFSVDEALALTSGRNITDHPNPIIMGLYSFAACEERPQDHLLPWEVKYTVDIGKAGGNGESVRADYKRGTHKSPFIKSALYDRICNGRTEYSPIYSTKQVNEAITKVREILADDNELWVNILHYETPNLDLTKPQLMPDVTLELFLCENEGQLAYKDTWGTPPIGNPGAKGKLKSEKRKQKRRKKSSSEEYFTQTNVLNYT